MQRPGSHSRLEIVDFLRGVAIIEMLAAHYAGYLPGVAAKFVDYTETAMPLFVLLAGFMVGWGCKNFEHEPQAQTLVLWQRGLRVLAVQYIIILTVGVPLYLLGMPDVESNQSLGVFVLNSMAFLNQIGLIHILPTFIPLFAISPAILWALVRGQDILVLLASVGLFCVGHYNPYILDFGQPTIFPFVLFQLYFVVGCLVGKHAQLRQSVTAVHAPSWLMASIALLLATMLLVHGKWIPARLISTHPLNLFGLMYQTPLVLTVCSSSLVFFPSVQRLYGYPLIARFGRHALLAFVLHLYLAKVLGVINHFVLLPTLANWGLILASVVAINATLKQYEFSLTRDHIPVWARAVHVLFR